MPFVIAVEGLIGAGKSTLLNVLRDELSKSFKVAIVQEPVDQWVSSGLLQRFYADKQRWSYSFQTKAFYDRITEAQQCFREFPDADIILMERSPVSDQIFMKTLHKDGFVDDLEYSMYKDWCSMWETLLPFSISLYLYVRTGLDDCMQRLVKRSRDGEHGVNRDYQARLLEEHDREFLGDDDSLVIDGTPDFRMDISARKTLIETILRRMENLC